jgi:PAS domain S-box-containing protein
MNNAIGNWIAAINLLPNICNINWPPSLIATYLISDLVIFLSYFFISVAIIRFARKRRDFSYRGALWLIAAFILTCGATHLTDAVLLWQPIYQIDTLLNVFTAAISMATVIFLWKLIPHLLRLPNPDLLRRINQKLRFEIRERKAVENALRLAMQSLEERLLARQILMAQVVESSDDAIFSWNLDGQISSWNRAAAEIFGYSEKEILGQHIATLTPSQNRAEDDRILKEVGAGVSIQHFETRRMRKDGTELDVAITASPLRDGSGRIIGVAELLRDISARKEAEESLRKLSLAIEQCPISVVITNLNAEVEYVNDALVTVSGYTRGEIVGKNPRLFRSGYTAGQEYTTMWQALLRGETWEGEIENRRKDGQKYIEYARISPIRRSDGKISHYLGIKEDVTVRRRDFRRIQALIRIGKMAEVLDERDFLSQGLELIEELTDSSIGFLHFVNDDQETIELVTWTAGALRGCTAAHDNHYPISAAGIWADCFREMGPVMFNDYPHYASKHGLPEGHAHLQRLISVPVIEDGKVRMMVGVGNKDFDYEPHDIETVQLLGGDLWSIVRRRRVESSLLESEEKFRTIYDSISDAVFVHDNDNGRILDVNRRACQMYGYSQEQLLQLTIPDISANMSPYTMDDAQRYLVMARDGKQPHFEWLARDNTGRHFWVYVYLDVISFAGEKRTMAVIRDIDNQKRVEDGLKAALSDAQSLNHKLTEAQNQLLQSEKMASLGQLAAGVAHELNNPIGFVRSNLGTLSTYVKDIVELVEALDQTGDLVDTAKLESLKAAKDFAYVQHDAFQLLDESREGLDRVSKIVQDLKLFSRAGESDWQWADLHAGLDSTLNIVWNELKYKCTLNKEYGTLPAVWCIPSQINQVFLNLLINAAHAIPEKGLIGISTGQQNDEVFVTVSDTGTGIAPENMNRIFEPFFTTKPVGKGTGLGLSLAYGIVKRHRGRFEVKSELGKGTAFTVWLPIKTSEETPTAPPALSAQL